MVTSIRPTSSMTCDPISPSEGEKLPCLEGAKQIMCRTFSGPRDVVFIDFASEADADNFVKTHGKQFAVCCEVIPGAMVRIYDLQEVIKCEAILKTLQKVFGEHILKTHPPIYVYR